MVDQRSSKSTMDPWVTEHRADSQHPDLVARTKVGGIGDLNTVSAMPPVRGDGYFKRSRSSARRSQDSVAPDSIPDSSMPSRSSTESKSDVDETVVLPSCSSKVTVSTTM